MRKYSLAGSNSTGVSWHKTGTFKREGDKMYKIFIVEDDETIAHSIADKLSSWGFESNVCNNFRNILTQFLEIEPHLVLMDISLPFFNGYHWCSEIRKISKVPIMFISSAGDKMNIVMAINMGADDFVSKPFDMDMLLAKIQALLRRTYDFTTQQSGIFQHDNIILNSTACTVTYHDNKLELSKNENKILTILLENKGQVVSRDILMNKLWETDCFIDENTLSVNVTRLRKSLAAIGVHDLIKTKKGMGYIIE